MKASTRNRHTGHVNAFKAAIIQRGIKHELNGRVYYQARVGEGITVVRTK